MFKLLCFLDYLAPCMLKLQVSVGLKLFEWGAIQGHDIVWCTLSGGFFKVMKTIASQKPVILGIPGNKTSSETCSYMGMDRMPSQNVINKPLMKDVYIV